MSTVRFADLETPGGYLCDEVASALQKSIRRGLEREALHWAAELDLAGGRKLRLEAAADHQDEQDHEEQADSAQPSSRTPLPPSSCPR